MTDMPHPGAFERPLTPSRRGAKWSETQAQSIHANRVAALGEMTASIVHELNQPLAAIAINAATSLNWLARANPEVSEGILAIRAVLEDVKRASGMIRRIRALASNNEPEMSKLDINSVIDDVMTLIEQEAESQRVSLRFDRTPRLPSVHADLIEIQQVIINLVVNGIQAMASLTDRSRRLVIRAREYDTHSVVVAVQDVGVGADVEDLEQLFGAFYSTKASGMGMGLAISRCIIEAHRGRIWATRNNGPGMTFQFTLPIHRDEP
jgi:C4-dicarboxylate-specific signal transduction histidine kinase